MDFSESLQNAEAFCGPRNSQISVVVQLSLSYFLFPFNANDFSRNLGARYVATETVLHLGLRAL